MSEMIKKLAKVELSSIVVEENVRLPNLENIPALQDDIVLRGVQEPLWVWLRGEEYVLIRGHRRLKAIVNIEATDKVAFEQWFGDGVPCVVVEGITAEEAAVLKIDHGTQESLSDPCEVQMAASMLFKAGKTEGDVTIILAGLLDRVSPMSTDKRKQYNDLLTAAREAEEKGLNTEARMKRADAEALLKAYRRGMVQGLHYTFRCPDKVFASRYYHACGVKLPAVENDAYIPTVSAGEAVKLHKAFEKDLGTRVNGVCPYNKGLPGPEFRAVWNSMIREQKARDEKKANAVPRAKAMSAEDMKNESWKSKGFQLLARKHAGEKDITGLAELDEEAYLLGLVSEHGTNEERDSMANLVFSGRLIEKELMKLVEIEAEANAKAKAEAEAEAEAEGEESNTDEG